MHDLTFAFLSTTSGDKREAVLLARSLAWLFPEEEPPSILLLSPQDERPPADLVESLRNFPVRQLQYRLPDSLQAVPFAQKVFAAAEAEAAVNYGSLAWLDTDTLVLERPDALCLPPGKEAAGCPVHLKNISSPADRPPDAFWAFLFEQCQTPAEHIFAITTQVDCVSIHAHFNAGCLSVRPGAGLFNSWKESFERIASTAAARPFLEKSPLHRTFFHQAVLAAVLLAHLSPDEILLLPEEYNYPVFLEEKHGLTPPSNPVTLRYDNYNYFRSGSPAFARWLPKIEHFNRRD